MEPFICDLKSWATYYDICDTTDVFHAFLLMVQMYLASMIKWKYKTNCKHCKGIHVVYTTKSMTSELGWEEGNTKISSIISAHCLSTSSESTYIHIDYIL